MEKKLGKLQRTAVYLKLKKLVEEVDEEHKLAFRSLVWGRLPGHPWWPCLIYDPLALQTVQTIRLAIKGLTCKKKMHIVYWMGAANFSLLSSDRLKPYRKFANANQIGGAESLSPGQLASLGARSPSPKQLASLLRSIAEAEACALNPLGFCKPTRVPATAGRRDGGKSPTIVKEERSAKRARSDAKTIVARGAVSSKKRVRSSSSLVLPGLHVQWPWSEKLLSGEKTIETRKYPISEARLGKEIAVIETPGRRKDFKARIIGTVVFSSYKEYRTKKEWDADAGKHCVKPNDPAFGMVRYGWVVKCTTRLDRPAPCPKRRGMVWAVDCIVPTS